MEVGVGGKIGLEGEGIEVAVLSEEIGRGVETETEIGTGGTEMETGATTGIAGTMARGGETTGTQEIGIVIASESVGSEVREMTDDDS